MSMKRQGAKGGASAFHADHEEPKMDIESILNDTSSWGIFSLFFLALILALNSRYKSLDISRLPVPYLFIDYLRLGSSHMTWKQKKDLENRKVVSHAGKPSKKQRLPLSVARVTMKKQKEREEKMLQESAILGSFGAYSSNGAKSVAERRQPEDRVLKSTEGSFRNGILDVKHLLRPSASRVAVDDNGRYFTSKGKKNEGGKNGHGGGTKRH